MSKYSVWKHESTCKSWYEMKQRCTNVKDKDYKNYGGRGITVCEEWLNSFQAFLRDMGERPNGMTLGRIDNNGKYCKDNCRWETVKEQSNNRRSNRPLTFKGVTKNMSEWAESLGIGRDTLYHRLVSGWSVEKALTQTKRKYRTDI